MDETPTGPTDAAGLPHADGVEIERKFLVTQLPAGLERYPSSRIEQGYLALDPQGVAVRLRRREGQTLLTIKAGDGLERAEEEFKIARARFERLWAFTDGRRVEKTRYELPADGGLTIELDVYDGDLAGLATAEVEAASRAAVLAFQPPAWMRLEVTDDRRYANARLAIDGIPPRKASGEHALLDGEPPAAGFVQVALAQVDGAADALQDAEGEQYAEAVHTARKALKRARALARVGREGLSDEVRRRDNAALRAAGAQLSGARDAKVVVETLDGLIKRHPEQLSGGPVDGLHAALTADFQAADRAARTDDGAVAGALATLAQARDGIAGWSLGDEPAAALASGFARIHRKGRQALRALPPAGDPSATEGLHELRKRTKDLWHAAELLEVAAPQRMNGLAAQAHELADLLGDDHDLAVLATQTAARPAAFRAEGDAERLQALITKRRTKLQRKARGLAGELYGAEPAALVKRIERLDGR